MSLCHARVHDDGSSVVDSRENVVELSVSSSSLLSLSPCDFSRILCLFFSFVAHSNGIVTPFRYAYVAGVGACHGLVEEIIH